MKPGANDGDGQSGWGSPRRGENSAKVSAGA
jgi:hypothetical protein